MWGGQPTFPFNFGSMSSIPATAPSCVSPFPRHPHPALAPLVCFSHVPALLAHRRRRPSPLRPPFPLCPHPPIITILVPPPPATASKAPSLPSTSTACPRLQPHGDCVPDAPVSAEGLVTHAVVRHFWREEFGTTYLDSNRPRITLLCVVGVPQDRPS